ncbi:MAG: hypothetical protein ACKV0T_27525 [Planctomycetales bacterium]
MRNKNHALWVYGGFIFGFVVEIFCTTWVGPLVLLFVWARFRALPFLLVEIGIGMFVAWRVLRWISRYEEAKLDKPPVQAPKTPSELNP